jgi:hypothetical protein
VVQIGSVSDIAKAVPANFKPVSIAPATGNGNGNGHSAPASQVKEANAEAVAGD